MEIKKPKAKKIDWNNDNGWSKTEQVGYNQACNDWEIYHQQEIDKLKVTNNLLTKGGL